MVRGALTFIQFVSAKRENVYRRRMFGQDFVDHHGVHQVRRALLFGFQCPELGFCRSGVCCANIEAAQEIGRMSLVVEGGYDRDLLDADFSPIFR